MMRRWWLLVVLTLCGALYTGRSLDYGWTPFDEGTLGQSAERVAQGERPHRDYDEVYTGGLSELNALAFRTFGERLSVLRAVLFVCFLLWLPAVYYIARQFAGPAPSSLATILAIIWSVPNYPAAMPSWYNLFFATWALAAILRFIDTDHQRWLFVAGLAAGLSILIKIVGLFLVAALFLALAWGEQNRSLQREETRPTVGRRFYSVALTIGLTGMVLALYGLVRRTGRVTPVIFFVLPTAMVAGAIIAREWRRSYRPDGSRLRVLLGWLVPLTIGIAIPVAIFVTPYVVSGGLSDLLRGVFIAPGRRLSYAWYPMPSVVTTWPAVLTVIIGAVAPFLRRRWQLFCAVVLMALLAVQAVGHPPFHLMFFASLRLVVPAVAIGGVILMSRLDDAAQWRLAALLAVMGLVSLVQFPYSGMAYFWYVGPLVVLSVLAVWTPLGPRVTPVAVVAVIWAIIFPMVRSNVDPVVKLGFVGRLPPEVPLASPRAGLLVPEPDAVAYDSVVRLVRRHAGRAPYVYATPDLPEISFLAGLRNPTRTLYDFFDDTTGRTGRIISLLKAHDVHVVVITSDPAFSDPVTPELDSALAAHYPNVATDGPFTVRWVE